MDINHLAVDIKDWADAVFPDRTDQSMYLKLYGEIAEMIDAVPEEAEQEFADVMIMLLDWAKRRGINPSTAIQRKMNINRQRTWAKNALGAYSHVKEA